MSDAEDQATAVCVAEAPCPVCYLLVAPREPRDTALGDGPTVSAHDGPCGAPCATSVTGRRVAKAHTGDDCTRCKAAGVDPRAHQRNGGVWPGRSS